jgi:hypothetical protein
MMSDPIESAIDAEHSRQERAWDEAMTDIRADLEEVPGLVEWLRDVADPRCSHSLDRKALERAADKLERLAAEVLRLTSNLTPSGETKADYIGEFSFTIDEVSGDVGAEVARKVDVPWTVIKEIMAVILARKALGGS